MSIQTQITRITDEVGTQTDLIAQISSVLDGKAAGIVPTGTVQITANGTHDVTEYASAEVSVPSEEPATEELTVTANGEYTPGDGVDGFSKVTVDVTGSGGTSVETCEVTINETAGYELQVEYTTVLDGVLTRCTDTSINLLQKTLTVAKNTLMYIEWGYVGDFFACETTGVVVKIATGVSGIGATFDVLGDDTITTIEESDM